MEPIWLKPYLRGVPAEVDVRRFAWRKEMLEQWGERFRKRPAFANLAAADKVPKQVKFRDRLPKSPIGKILRRKRQEQQTAATGGEGR